MIFINNNYKAIQLTTFFTDFDTKETLVHRFLLPKLLVAHTNMLNTKRLMNDKLATLYGAYFSARNNRIGNLSVTRISLVIPNYKIVDDPSLLDNALLLFKSVIFEHDQFNEEVFVEEKRMIIEHYETIKDKKRAYSSLRFLEHFFKGDILGYKMKSIIKDLKKLTSGDLIDYYKNTFLKNKTTTIANGDFTKADQEKIKKVLNYEIENEIVYKTKTRKNKKIIMISEKAEMKQAIIHLGYNLPVFRNDDLVYATVLLNIILGGYPESRLFKTIREKEGLCYDVSSRYDRDKGVLMISSGVDEKKKDYALKAIKEIVNELLIAGVTSAELDNAKSFYSHQIKSSCDNQFWFTDNAFYDGLSKKVQTIEDRLVMISKVNVGDVLLALKKLSLSTIYVLHGGKDD